MLEQTYRNDDYDLELRCDYVMGCEPGRRTRMSFSYVHSHTLRTKNLSIENNELE